MNPAPPLPDDVKKRLRTLVLELRGALEDDLARELKRLGVDPAKPTLTPTSDLPYLTEEEISLREVIDAALEKERVLTGTFEDAITEFRKEAAYTHLNRLMGLRCLEVRGHVVVDGEPTEAIAPKPEFGGRPKLLWTLRDADPSLRQGPDAEERLWRAGLMRAYEQVSSEIGVLFDPDDPYAAVWPSHATLRAVIDRLNELPVDAFRADELLGWVYQYFQSEEKDRVFEEVRTKKKKVSWSDIVPVTQLYTERYMVDFLLQNSIGRRLMDMYPDSGAAESWPYYVTPATPNPRDPQPVRDWTILDPCVGSGHFLVVAFDLLIQLYAKERELAEQGVIPKEWTVAEDEVAATILSHNLYGIDIDPRAVQLAALALYLKAKDHGLTSLKRINLVVADAVLTRGKPYEELLSHYADDPPATAAIEAIWHALEHVRDLGSLVRVEEEVEAAVESSRRRAGPLLATQIDWDAYKRELLTRIALALSEELASEDISERIFGREGLKGLNLLHLLSRRYDVVCTNPPYMGSKNMAPVMKSFVAKHYPSGKRDLYAAFILRCLELATQGGHVAMVTQQSWMFLRRMADLRSEDTNHPVPTGLLHEAVLETLVHLGEGAFSSPAAAGAFVTLISLVNSRVQETSHFRAFRLTQTRGVERKRASLLDALQNEIWFERPQLKFTSIPSSPLAYWLPGSLFELLQGRTVGDLARVAQGLATAWDARFIRGFWEVPALAPITGWQPITKGGGYGKWAGFDHWVVDWSQNGAVLRSYENAVIRNDDCFFSFGWTYSYMARGGLGLRRVNGDAIFSHLSSAIIPEVPRLPIAACLNCRLATFLIRSVSGKIQLTESYVVRLPVPRHFPPGLKDIEDSLVTLKRVETDRDPAERSFNVRHRIQLVQSATSSRALMSQSFLSPPPSGRLRYNSSAMRPEPPPAGIPSSPPTTLSPSSPTTSLSSPKM